MSTVNIRLPAGWYGAAADELLCVVGVRYTKAAILFFIRFLRTLFIHWVAAGVAWSRITLFHRARRSSHTLVMDQYDTLRLFSQATNCTWLLHMPIAGTYKQMGSKCWITDALQNSRATKPWLLVRRGVQMNGPKLIWLRQRGCYSRPDTFPIRPPVTQSLCT